MSALRPAHAVWLMRRAAILDGTSADAASEPRDPARAALLHRVAAKVTDAVDRHRDAELSPSERTLLVTEAQDLTSRAAREVTRTDNRDLRGAEEWVMMARAFREILEATPGDA